VEGAASTGAVVNNAGINGDDAIEDVSWASFSKSRVVSAGGTFLITKADWPYIIKSGHARAVMTASVTGVFGAERRAYYTIGAVYGLMHSPGSRRFSQGPAQVLPPRAGVVGALLGLAYSVDIVVFYGRAPFVVGIAQDEVGFWPPIFIGLAVLILIAAILVAWARAPHPPMGVAQAPETFSAAEAAGEFGAMIRGRR
jgi:hypothetical protein